MSSPLLNKLFEREQLSELLAYYETNYQVAVGLLVALSGFDQEDMTSRLDKMNLEMDTERVLYLLIDAAGLFSKEKDPIWKIRKEIKKLSALQALDDMIERDEELENIDYFEEEMTKKIMDGSFFDGEFDQMVHTELSSRISVWKEIMTPDLVDQIASEVLL